MLSRCSQALSFLVQLSAWNFNAILIRSHASNDFAPWSPYTFYNIFLIGNCISLDIYAYEMREKIVCLHPNV